MEEALFTEITNDPVLASKLDAGGSYRIFPLVVPEGVAPAPTLTYTEITQRLTYPVVRGSSFQINCSAPTFEEARDLANDIDRLFNDRSEFKLGGTFGVKYIRFQSRTSYRDPDANLYIFAVELSIKY